VYKGEMGAKHRQAARMQGKAGSQASAKRGSTTGSGASLVSSPRFIACAAVAVCLALSCLFLYPSAQQYYQSVRDRDRLAAEYAALVERNGAIEGEVATLQTDSGIESRAHEQLGWVKDGEQTARCRASARRRTKPRRQHRVGQHRRAGDLVLPFLDPLFGVE
ncbi:MAG: FtsB family cell division protein, partial [Eggerthellaceae bacterium]